MDKVVVVQTAANNPPALGIKLERCRQCKEVYTSQHNLLKSSALFSDIDIYDDNNNNNNNNNSSVFRAHKFILATGSTVFKEYLTMYPHTSSLNIKSFIKHDPFHVAMDVLEFLYSRHIVVNSKNILAIIRVAKLLRIDDLLKLSHAVLFRVCAQDPCSMLPMCIQFNYVNDHKLLTYLVDVLVPKIESKDISSVQALAHFNILDFENFVLKHLGLSMHAKFFCLQVYVELNLIPPNSPWPSSTTSHNRTCLIHHNQRAVVTDPKDDLCTCSRVNTPISQDQCIRLWSLINFNALSPDLLATAFRIPNIPQHHVFDAVMAKLVNTGGQHHSLSYSNSDAEGSSTTTTTTTISEKHMKSGGDSNATISRLVDIPQHQNPLSSSSSSSSAQASPVNSMHHGPIRPLGTAPVLTPPFARAAYSQNASTVDLHYHHHHHQYHNQVTVAAAGGGGGSILRPQSVPPLDGTPSPVNSDRHHHSSSSPTTTITTTNPKPTQKQIDPVMTSSSLQLQTLARTQMDTNFSNIVEEYASPSLTTITHQVPQYTPTATTTTGSSQHDQLPANFNNNNTLNSIHACESVYNHVWTIPDSNTSQPSMYVQQEYVIPSTSSPQQHVKVLGPVHELQQQPITHPLSSAIPPRRSSSDANTTANALFPDLHKTCIQTNHGPSPLHVPGDNNGGSDPGTKKDPAKRAPGPKQDPAKRAPYKSHKNVTDQVDTFDTNGVVLAHKKKKGVMARLSSLVR